MGTSAHLNTNKHSLLYYHNNDLLMSPLLTCQCVCVCVCVCVCARVSSVNHCCSSLLVWRLRFRKYLHHGPLDLIVCESIHDSRDL